MHYVVNVSTGPTSEPVTLEEALLHLRVTDSSEHERIEGLITDARITVEQFCNRKLMTQTLDLYLDRFPCGAIRLPGGPVASVTSIVYTAADGTANTAWNSANYTTDLFSEPARIVPLATQSYPATYVTTNAVRVRYVAGYASAAAVPQSIKEAIKLIVEQNYDEWDKNRDTCITNKLTPFVVGDEFTEYGVSGYSYA